MASLGRLQVSHTSDIFFNFRAIDQSLTSAFRDLFLGALPSTLMLHHEVNSMCRTLKMSRDTARRDGCASSRRDA